MAIRERITLLEDERAALKERLEEVAKLIATGGKAQIERRCTELRATIKAHPLDKERVNGLLRGLASAVTMDYEEGELVFAWQHGGEARITYDYQWDEAA